MKALFQIEDIGESVFDHLAFKRCGLKRDDIFDVPRQYYVKHINGKYIKGYRDYSRSNGKGTRGIIVTFFLDQGVYEVRHKTSWEKHSHYFFRVNELGDIEKISKAEAMQCLKK